MGGAPLRHDAKHHGAMTLPRGESLVHIVSLTSFWLVALALAALISAGPISAQAEHTVAMMDSPDIPLTAWSFAPGEVTVTVGDFVQWVNAGQQLHTATAEDRSWGSEMVEPGQSFRLVFDAEGTYPYRCTPHPWMRGVVTVLARTQDDEDFTLG